MTQHTTTRFVVALEIAGTAHLVVEAEEPAAAIALAFDKVRRPDLQDWWARRADSDYIAPHAQPYPTGGQAFGVGLPIVGTAYVTVEASDPTQAIAQAYAQVTEEDLDDWRPDRGPVRFHLPAVALEADVEE